ncbi:MAG TPA: ATP-dependent sacrificial sulfur transferase LarE [Myxococcales bacterium]|nr:ATP-dependent sacrificial sulfur transferase LarE [Myxococcales bacterium]
MQVDLTLARSKEDVARQRLRSLGSVLVAYSGGVDSSYLLWLAREVLGTRAVAFTALSAAVPADELAAARDLARALGAEHVEKSSAEIDDPRYVRNASDRCYFCKTELYELASRHARASGIAAVVSGTNADDLLDYRPGLAAASEHEVVHPLAEAKLSKAEIRLLSRAAGLPTWDKPQQPCLASRIPYGTEVTRERLAQLARAEMALRALGLREFRVRFHGEIARIEVAEGELSRLVEVRAEAARALREAGFRFVGPTTVYAAMQACGVVNDHLAGCWVRADVERELAA